MNSLSRNFHYQNRQIRTLIRDSEPWFVAADVCGVLGLDTSQAVNGRRRDGRFGGLDGDEKGTAIVSTPGGRQEMLIVSEAGLYSLVLKSRKSEAKAFRRWITHEVIPALHRSGGYRMDEMPGKAGTLLQFSRRDLLHLAIEAENECQELRGAVAELAPKAEFFDRVADTTSTFSLGEVAKMMDVPGLGRNNLVKFLREEGILMADNVAKQRYVDRGYFQIVQADYYAPDGTLRVKAVTRVKEKGVEFIRHRLDEYLLGYMERQNTGL